MDDTVMREHMTAMQILLFSLIRTHPDPVALRDHLFATAAHLQADSATSGESYVLPGVRSALAPYYAELDEAVAAKKK